MPAQCRDQIIVKRTGGSLRLIFFVLQLILFFCGGSFAGEISVTAKSALVYDITAKKILYSKNPDRKLSAASTIKIMTAILAAERLQPSAMIEKALGERPREADRAALWNEGVETIYSYRQRHGISSRSGEPLGREPHPGQDRSDWVKSQRRLSQVQAALDHTPVREVERGIAIEL